MRGRSLLLNAAPLGTSWHLQAHQHCHLMEAPMTPSTGQSIKSTHIATQSSSTLPSHGRHHPRLQHHAPDGSFKIRDGKPPFLKHLGTLDLGTHYTLVHPSTLLGATTTPCTHENMPDHDIQISSTFQAACIIIITVSTSSSHWSQSGQIVAHPLPRHHRHATFDLTRACKHVCAAKKISFSSPHNFEHASL